MDYGWTEDRRRGWHVVKPTDNGTMSVAWFPTRIEAESLRDQLNLRGGTPYELERGRQPPTWKEIP